MKIEVNKIEDTCDPSATIEKSRATRDSRFTDQSNYWSPGGIIWGSGVDYY